MPETITARAANHHFSRVLNEVAEGKEFLVTRDGVPIARIIPERLPDGRRRLTPAQEEALARSVSRLQALKPVEGAEPIGRFDRNDLYDSARPWIERFLRD